MRNLFAATSLCLALAQASTASAQAPSKRAYEETTSQSPATRMSFTQQNFFERASYSARERTLRMEARKWYGVSASRPDYYPVDINDRTLGHWPGGRFYGNHLAWSPWRGTW